ncbi:MAG: MBL fold metallo-hydrolase [Coriobacteriales bacterium]|nr:MBL fold metallo-hydrolase [Coriobacteriales bacterium]
MRRVVTMVMALLVMLGVPHGVARAASDEARIHVLTFSNYEEAIIVESDGRFGIVDSGEDDDAPDGSDKRYPFRTGTYVGAGHTAEFISYLQSLGATSDNVEFYIGTHAHSDHVGSADEVIRAFSPERVYTPDYRDSYIYDSARLWDNQYNFDRMAEAAQEVGASFITSLSYDAPVDPGDGDTGYPSFDLGSAEITIMNWENHPLSKGAYSDANDYCWGVLVSCGGSTAFLAADINNYGGDEDRLASQLGHVDVLTLAHHGSYGSNSGGFLNALSPGYAVQTAPFSEMPSATVNTLLSLGSHIYVAPECAEQGKRAIVITLSSDGVAADALTSPSTMTFRESCGSFDAVAFVDGAPTSYEGTWTSPKGRVYYFDNSPYGELDSSPGASTTNGWNHNRRGWWWRNSDGTYPTNCWKLIAGKWYYFNASGYMMTGWLKYSRYWYYLDASGAMATGWRKVDGSWYYLDASRGGAMVTGFFTIGSKRYVARPDGVCPVSGWVRQGYSWFFTSPSCTIVTGWAKSGKSWYYLDPSNGGAMVTGWIKVKNIWYYLDPSNGGAMTTGWKKFDGSWYWFNASGVRQKGWAKVGKSWYYLDPAHDGAMVIGWLKEKSAWYYLNSSGAMVTGWKKLDGNWYWFNASGVAQKGWAKIGGSWYWFDSDRKMLANGWTPDGCYVNANGAWVKGKTR